MSEVDEIFSFEGLLEKSISKRDPAATKAVRRLIETQPSYLYELTRHFMANPGTLREAVVWILSDLSVGFEEFLRLVEEGSIEFLACLCLLAEFECQALRSLLTQIVPFASERLLYFLIGMAINESHFILRALNDGLTQTQMENIVQTIVQHRAEFPFLVGPFLRLLESREFRPRCLVSIVDANGESWKILEILASLGNRFAEDRLVQFRGGYAAALASNLH